MWSLRRASIHLKNCGLSSGASRILFVKLEIPTHYLEKYSTGYNGPQEISFENLLAKRFYNTSFPSSKLCVEVRSFSSQSGSNKNVEDDDEMDLENAFSDPETPHDLVHEAISGDELITESELFEEEGGEVVDMQNDLETLDTGTGAGERRSSKTEAASEMIKFILAAPASPVNMIMDKWVEEGNKVNRTDATLCMLELRKRRLFVKALQLSNWLEATKCFDFLEGNYASRLDLIAKVSGFSKAERYMQQIPESFRGEILYRTLLANCVATNNVKKSKELFTKMRDLGLPVTSFSCNQLLLLYKRSDRRKIADVLLLMEKENIKPSYFTYQILIDVKGQAKDISGMEEIVQSMRSEGVKPSTQILASLAHYYVAAGLNDKAEITLKEMEGDNIKETPWVCRWLLPVYASLGREDKVTRIWEECESKVRFGDCLAVIEAWGKLKKIENAEAAFEMVVKKIKNPTSKHFSTLLKVYADHKMLAKGKDLVKRMVESGCHVGPVTWDAIVKLYVESGEVEKADNVLEKLVQHKKHRPLFTSLFTLMEGYAKRGDVHNAEKLFLRIKQVGYAINYRLYQALLQAYINAKAPAYGMNERMKGDNFFPSGAMTKQLAQIHAFQKNAVAAASLVD